MRVRDGTFSVLHEKFPNAPGGATGWQGTDCTMPICVAICVVIISMRSVIARDDF